MTYMKVLNKLFILLIKAYRLLLSPLIGARCRFTPTCSAYGLESFQTLPFHRALVKTLIRVSKCHPFHPGGHDPLDK